MERTAWNTRRTKNKLSGLKRYEEKFKQATFFFNRGEGCNCKDKHTTAKKFYNKNESLCEDALEILQETFYSDNYLCIGFDKDISFKAGINLSADIVSLPSLVTSPSSERLKEDRRITSKQDLKLTVVERAIDIIGRDTAPASKSANPALDKFLNTDD